MKEGKEITLKKSAMQLTDPLCFAKTSDGEGENSKPKLKMTAYSGKVIKGHWYWGDLVIDTEGMSIPKKKIPILEDHDTSRKVGFATKFNQQNQLEIEESEFVDTPFSQEFIKLSKQGFPFEASIYAKPSHIERLTEEDSAQVNGFTFKGPGTIWRKSQLREVSICTFGYDSQTKSVAMAEDETIVVKMSEKEENKTKEVSMKLTMEQFKAENPEEFARLSQAITSDTEAKFRGEIEGLKTKNQELSASLAASEEDKKNLSASNEAMSERVLKLEKAEDLRKEREIQFTADAIFADKLKDSGIPERLHAKVRKQVSHEKFITEGAFDKEAFSKAVEEELKDWAGEGSSSSVMGFASNEGKDGTSDMFKEDAMVDRMVKYVQ